MFDSILHSSVIVRDTKIALHFYEKILGLKVNHNRPDLGYPGAWLNIGEQQIHLLELPNPDPINNRPAHGGRDRHTAIATTQFDKLIALLKSNNIEYTLSKSGRKALFCRDPDGNALEFISTE